MNSHNTRATATYHKTPITTNRNTVESKIVSSSLTHQTELALDDDYDLGTDPYNATGQHVVLKKESR